MASIHDHKDYKKYVNDALGGNIKRSGLRSKAAEAMGVQLTYLSRVLNAEAHLSLEQALQLSEFLGHTEEERKIFLLLLQKDRAGTKKLEQHFQKQIDEIHEKRQLIQNRVKLREELNAVDQAKYYSRWYYACIHVMISIPELSTKAAIATQLNLSISVVTEALEFLISCGLAEDNHDRFSISKRHIHLGSNSENIQKHHMNWRVQAMSSLDNVKKNDLHYSVIISLSRQDATKLKERILQVIEDNMKDVGPSKEEVVYCQAFDFFEINRKI